MIRKRFPGMIYCLSSTLCESNQRWPFHPLLRPVDFVLKDIAFGKQNLSAVQVKREFKGFENEPHEIMF